APVTTSTTAITAPAQPSTSFHSTTAMTDNATATLHRTRLRRRVLCSVAVALSVIAVVLWNDVLGWAGAVIAVVLVVTGA
ncbi:hypothetical protein ACU8YE_25750, partial [Ralstonia sp. VS2407]